MVFGDKAEALPLPRTLMKEDSTSAQNTGVWEMMTVSLVTREREGLIFSRDTLLLAIYRTEPNKSLNRAQLHYVKL